MTLVLNQFLQLNEKHQHSADDLISIFRVLLQRGVLSGPDSGADSKILQIFLAIPSSDLRIQQISDFLQLLQILKDQQELALEPMTLSQIGLKTTSIEYFTADEIFDLFFFLEDRQWVEFFQPLFRKLPDKIVEDIFSYNFEKMCYFYYLINKHREKFEDFPQTQKRSNVIKEYIKSHYFSLSNRQKPKPGESFYYLILEVVDPNDFYVGFSDYQ